MSTEPVSIGRSMATGAGMAALWFAIFLVVLFGCLKISNDDVVNGVLMALTFLGVVLLPALGGGKYQNLKAGFFLCLGGVLVVMPMFIALVMYLLSGLKVGGHN